MKKNNDYYPVVNNKIYYAKNSKGRYKYAKDSNGTIIYPKENNHETYIVENGVGSFNLLKDTQGFVTYVKRDKKEMYPTLNAENETAEMIIDNYAKDSSNQFYYPVDSYNNEYTNKTGDFIQHLGYPITNNGYIIIPNINKKPKFFNQDVTEKEIKYILLRPGFTTYDFLTNKLSFRKPRTSLQKQNSLL
ncbi:hypothetical protein TNCT_592441 [Trichonephila clavata]|uniref:Uncharacterized protein n=1 Tax=Trichonephila clavata TaxID=2740835 RepID=A0A8X6KFW6_TRICU|nr:hypothetical protein TNCT_592441 [Trichonephila clavata]